MEIKGKKYVVIYLTDWQRRMVKDFLGVDCHRWVVPIGQNGGVRYAVGIPAAPEVKKMYFTDWQKREIKDEAGEACDFVELKKGTIPEYGVVPGV